MTQQQSDQRVRERTARAKVRAAAFLKWLSGNGPIKRGAIRDDEAIEALAHAMSVFALDEIEEWLERR